MSAGCDRSLNSIAAPFSLHHFCGALDTAPFCCSVVAASLLLLRCCCVVLAASFLLRHFCCRFCSVFAAAPFLPRRCHCAVFLLRRCVDRFDSLLSPITFSASNSSLKCGKISFYAFLRDALPQSNSLSFLALTHTNCGLNWISAGKADCSSAYT